MAFTSSPPPHDHVSVVAREYARLIAAPTLSLCRTVPRPSPMVRRLAANRLDAEAFVRRYSEGVRAPTVIDGALPAAADREGDGTHALEQYTRFPDVHAKLRAQIERARQALERWEAQRVTLRRTRDALLLLAMLQRRDAPKDQRPPPLPAPCERASALRRALADRVRRTL
jgi:hypothetical protein